MSQLDDHSEETIGTCWLEGDTIVLKLIATGPGGVVGQGVLRYSPEHAQYQEILAHVGPLLPGQIKPVRPWS